MGENLGRAAVLVRFSTETQGGSLAANVAIAKCSPLPERIGARLAGLFPGRKFDLHWVCVKVNRHDGGYAEAVRDAAMGSAEALSRAEVVVVFCGRGATSAVQNGAVYDLFCGGSCIANATGKPRVFIDGLGLDGRLWEELGLGPGPGPDLGGILSRCAYVEIGAWRPLRHARGPPSA